MSLFYRKYGSGEALIILHGLFGSSMNWNAIGKKLSADYTVYLVDQRNHGKSFHSDDFNYVLLSKDINDFMLQNNIEKAHLLGHSMGGKAALQFVFDYPEKLLSVIIVDIGIKQFDFKDSDLLQAMVNLRLHEFTNRQEIDHQLAIKIPEFSLRQFIMQNIKRSKEGNFQWRMNLSVLYENINEVGRKIETGNVFYKPALFIRGSDSNYIMDEDKKEINKYFKKVTYNDVKGAGHWVHFDQPNEFLKRVQAFL